MPGEAVLVPGQAVCISRGEKLLELATVEEAAAVPSSRQGAAWIGGENHAYVR